ncbi:MAG: sigma-54-dependent transcriptional regulator [bacterium]
MKGRILVVDDEAGMREFLKAVLEDEGYEVSLAKDGREAFSKIESQNFHLIMTDLRMPGMDGMEVLRRAKELDPTAPVIVITAYGSIESAVAAMKAGADDYLTKPLSNLDELRLVVRNALSQRRIMNENIYLREEVEERYRLQGFVAVSPKMHEVLRLVDSVAKTPATVLIRGESGTGKELVARAIHNLSDRKDGPFVAVNCAALADNLLESELFGHERGAFTGATSQRKGRFELADGGTLFLDEIGEMSPSMQAKLLRAIQEKSFERVGGTKTIEVDVRLIAATNKNLEEAMERREFREDLFYRLNVMSISIPPLRERTEDIIPLAEAFLRRFASALQKRVDEISPEAKRVLLQHRWPGNIRELENAIERAVIVAQRNIIRPQDLPFAKIVGPDPGDIPLLTLKEMERRMIEKALKVAGGSREEVAKTLGISVRGLQYKLRKYGLK